MSALAALTLEFLFMAPRRFEWVEGTHLMGAFAPPSPAPLAAAGVRGELGMSGLRARQEELVLSRSGGQILGYGCQCSFQQGAGFGKWMESGQKRDGCWWRELKFWRFLMMIYSGRASIALWRTVSSVATVVKGKHMPSSTSTRKPTLIVATFGMRACGYRSCGSARSLFVP